MRASLHQEARIPCSLSAFYHLLSWLVVALVVVTQGVFAQEAPPSTEPAPVPPGPLPPPQERLLSPIPQRFDWISREVRPNPTLEPLLALQEMRRQLLMTVTLAEEYFDNFDQDDEEPREEYRTSLGLGTVYRLDKSRGFVSLANSIRANYEARSQNYNLGFANLSLNLGYELPRLSLALSDSFLRDDDISQTSTSNIREGRRTFTRNSITPQLRYVLSRLTAVTLAYTNTVVVNEGEENDTSISHTVGTGLQHRFSRRLSGNLGYGFIMRDEEEDAESRTHDATAGLEYIFTRRTNLSLQTFSTLISRRGGGSDSQIYGINAGIRHRFSVLVDFFAAAGATVTDIEGEALRADPNWQVTLAAALSPRTNLSLLTQGSVSDTGGGVDNVGLVLRQSVNLTLDQTLTRVFRLALFAGYTRTEFLSSAGTDESDPGRKDNYWQAGAHATYILTQIWSLSLQYQYQRRDSNRAENDFDANQVTLAVTGRFSVL
jgi:hypothetical protein